MVPLIVIINPVCGSGEGKEFAYAHVLPLLKSTPPAGVYETDRAEHAGELVLDYLKTNHCSAVTVAIISGDGTIHEIINTVQELAGKSYEIDFVLVPAGTANALFASLFAVCPNRDTSSPSYALQSLHSYLAATVPRPLTIMTTRIYSDDPSVPRTLIRSAVVTSTSLHASILNDSESLRAKYPSIDRFKIAAQQNIKRWYSATVQLLPMQKDDPSEPQLLKYSTQASAFTPVSTSESSAMTLRGPFTYFMSTSNVDRLEPEFCIAPLQSKYPSNSPCLDVIIVRPGRDSSLGEAKNQHELFADKMGEVFKGAYSAGTHVNLVHDGQGGLRQADAGSQGVGMVEYYRCGGWQWTPDPDDHAAHLVCADGTILELKSGESAQCTVSQPWEDEPRFTVFGR